MQHCKLSATVLATTKEGRGSSLAVEKESEIIGIPRKKEKPPRREIRSGALSSHNPRLRCYPELQYIVCRLISSSRGDLKMLAFVFTILVMTAGAPPASEPSWSWLENGKPLQLNRYNQTTQHATEADETVAPRTTLTSPARLRVPWLWGSVSTLHPLLEPTRCWNRHAASVRTTHRSAPVFGGVQQHQHAGQDDRSSTRKQQGRSAHLFRQLTIVDGLHAWPAGAVPRRPRLIHPRRRPVV